MVIILKAMRIVCLENNQYVGQTDGSGFITVSLIPVEGLKNARFQVLTAAIITAFWDMAPCSVLAVGDVSEMHTTSIIRAMKRRSTSTTLHGAISQKAVIFGCNNV
jgi:hypothetical protein